MSEESGPPIFLVGMGRSGSTLIFEVLASHPDLGWFSNYCDVLPRWPQVAVLSRLASLGPSFRKAVAPSGERPPWIDRYRIGPTEPYALWERLCGEKFRYDYLLGLKATEAERQRVQKAVRTVLRWQGKKRFLGKITGPPRIEYLASIFPDAQFVHIVRDGRSVVHSLLNVGFWRERGRLYEPAWSGGFPEAYRKRWEALGRSPVALAALQWRNVVETARSEATQLAPGKYRELRYEDFIADPDGALGTVLETCGLAPSPQLSRFLTSRFSLRNRNKERAKRFTAAEEELLESLLGDVLRELGYAAPDGVSS